MNDATAQCYGWIINKQSTKSVLNQLGECTGIFGLFTTLVAILTYLGKSKLTIAISVTLFAICGAGFVLSIIFKLAYSLLNYAVLGLGILLGAYGMRLHGSLGELEKKRNSGKTLENMLVADGPSPGEPMSKPLTTIAASPSHGTILPRTSQVTPE
ncbi:unnamed protein product [Adineta steineri]|uniref:Uncharacterized protein n=1 Tax=Adineta steineri TaxID=433720 RepID=A0A819Z8Z1_9BILA|nr:unnamed protein product [Adineta steineri]CAF1285025.1 unnamed protein product [Adineta steineri]CAF3983912.1 unnamed protein product [Adineta steineri]CAF4170334.1 unnamed protein product [Adineta steineri]